MTIHGCSPPISEFPLARSPGGFFVKPFPVKRSLLLLSNTTQPTDNEVATINQEAETSTHHHYHFVVQDAAGYRGALIAPLGGCLISLQSGHCSSRYSTLIYDVKHTLLPCTNCKQVTPAPGRLSIPDSKGHHTTIDRFWRDHDEVRLDHLLKIKSSLLHESAESCPRRRRHATWTLEYR